MTKIFYDSGAVEISGNDVGDLTLHVDEYEATQFANLAARRVSAAKLHDEGVTWSQAKKQSETVMASTEMLTVVKLALSRGSNGQQAIDAAFRASRFTVVKN